jgi:hypothetical protein
MTWCSRSTTTPIWLRPAPPRPRARCAEQLLDGWLALQLDEVDRSIHEPLPALATDEALVLGERRGSAGGA